MRITGRIWPFIAAYILAALLMVILTPPFQLPDEPTHLAECLDAAAKPDEHRVILEMEILRQMARYKFWQYIALPEPESVPLRFYDAPLLRIRPTQATKPELYFILGGGLIKLFRIHDSVIAMYLLRILGIGLGLAAALILVLTAKLACEDSRVRFLAVGTLFVPQFVYMSGSVNPANLSWIAGGLILAGSLQIAGSPRTAAGYGLILLGIVLALASHRAGLITLPAAAVALIIHLVRSRRRIAGLSRTLSLSISLGAGTAALAAWLMAAGWFPGIVRAAAGHLARMFAAVLVGPVPISRSPAWWLHCLTVFHKGAWMVFGWFAVFAHPAVYGFLALISIGALAGTALLIADRFRPDRMKLLGTAQLAVLLAAIAGGLWFGAGQYAVRGQIAQGRYMFPALPAFAVLYAAAWIRLTGNRTGIWTVRAGIAVLWAVFVCSVTLVFIPAFYL
ncbi:hypothetical protein JXA40_06735 [bacterium]|nr:hypothetical protein [candidate division CSSED10-310 bacterium]